jgi:hypothetical protein
MANKTIPLTHDHEWTNKEWDWPMQHNDGVVKVINTPDMFDVHFDCQFFTPKEIEVRAFPLQCKATAFEIAQESESCETRAYRGLANIFNVASLKF